MPRVHRILSDATPKLVLVALEGGRAPATIKHLVSNLPQGCTWIDLEEALAAPSEQYQEPALTAAHLALIQYTSGSTSRPKGVMVTHGNLSSNQVMIRKAMGHSESSTFVSWLPPHHDMGLIGNLMQPLHAGAQCIFMPPEQFLRSPSLWLKAISRYRAHTSGAPNFAYDLCVKRVREAELEGLDLSSWQVAYNGAEPVRWNTLRAFSGKFAPYGFSPRALYPTYGLAEATLMVTGKLKGTSVAVRYVARGPLTQNEIVEVEPDSDAAVALIGCGGPLESEELRIVDPNDNSGREPGQVGEIWVRGDNVAAGYWNSATSSAGKTFGAALASGENGFLRTGDLGFLLHGELFVTGRRKDLMVFRGRNHYPHDVEEVVDGSHSAFSLGHSAAFSDVIEGEERLVILAELSASTAKLDGHAAMNAAVGAVAETLGLAVHEMLLVERASIPRTTSGKHQRATCRELYRASALKVHQRWSPERGHRMFVQPRENPAGERSSAVSVAARIALEYSRLANCDAAHVDASSPLTAYGLDSLRALEVQHFIEAEFGVRLPPSYFLRGHSIEDAAEQVLRRCRARSEPPSGSAARTRMSRGQRAIWFEQQLAPQSAAYNLFFAATALAGLDEGVLGRAFEALQRRHEVLRASFSMGEEGPEALIAEAPLARLEALEAVALTDSEFDRLLEENAYRPFDLESGPPLRLLVFHRASGASVLLLVVHHVASDLRAMVELISELIASCAGLEQSVPSAMQRPYRDFVAREDALVSSSEGERLWEYWKTRIPQGERPFDLRTDSGRDPRVERAAALKSFRLGAVTCARLRRSARARNVTSHSILLTACAVTLAHWTAAPHVFLGCMASGRTLAEFARTIGHFANPIVMKIDLSEPPEWHLLVQRTHAHVMEALDRQDYPFSSLVNRASPARTLNRTPFFDCMLVHQQLPFHSELAPCVLGNSRRRFTLHGIELESVPIATRVCRYDLTVYLVDSGCGIDGAVVYDQNLFRTESIAAFTRRLRECIGAISNSADAISD
jgi:acyl-CoA synthetase (AMP-forming)/AMP-acid ligase II/acyl carrier protein